MGRFEFVMMMEIFNIGREGFRYLSSWVNLVDLSWDIGFMYVTSFVKTATSQEQDFTFTKLF